MAEYHITVIRMEQILDGWQVESTTSGLELKYKTFHAASPDSRVTPKLQFVPTTDSILVSLIWNRLNPETLHTYQEMQISLRPYQVPEIFIAALRPHFLASALNLSTMMPPEKLLISRYGIFRKEQVTEMHITWALGRPLGMGEPA